MDYVTFTKHFDAALKELESHPQYLQDGYQARALVIKHGFPTHGLNAQMPAATQLLGASKCPDFKDNFCRIAWEYSVPWQKRWLYQLQSFLSACNTALKSSPSR